MTAGLLARGRGRFIAVFGGSLCELGFSRLHANDGPGLAWALGIGVLPLSLMLLATRRHRSPVSRA